MAKRLEPDEIVETLCGDPVSELSPDEQAERRADIKSLAAAFRETRRIQMTAWFNNDAAQFESGQETLT